MKALKLCHIGTKELRTDRLFLRRIKKEDIQNIYSKIATDKNILKFVSWEYSSLESVEKMVLNTLEEYENKKDTYMWIVEELSTHEIVGMIFTEDYNERRLVAELDYCVVAGFRGKGYATEMLKKVIEYLIFEVGFFRIECVHNLDNPASGKVMQKAGMKFEGILRGKAINLNQEGNPDDLKLYSIIKTDFN